MAGYKRILTLRVSRGPRTTDKEKFTWANNVKDRILLNMTYDQHEILVAMANSEGLRINTFSLNNGARVYYTDFSTMWTLKPEVQFDIETFEKLLIGNASYFRNIPKAFHSVDYGITLLTSKVERDILNYKQNLELIREQFTDAVENLATNEAARDVLVKKIHLYKNRYKFSQGLFHFVYDDVIAEDSQADGDDIDLGSLTYEVDVMRKTVKFKSGSNPKTTQYKTGAFHPHHMSDDSLCLGSLEPDVRECITNMDLDVLDILLSKFSKSYTSSDSAGKYWKEWIREGSTNDEEQDEYTHFCEMRQEYYHEDNLNWSEEYEEWFHVDDSQWSEWEQDYLITLPENDRLARELHDGQYCRPENAIELANGEFAHEEDTDVINFRSGLYLKSDTIYSELLDVSIPAELALSTVDGWITSEELIVDPNGAHRYNIAYTAELAKAEAEEAERARILAEAETTVVPTADEVITEEIAAGENPDDFIV